MPPFVLLEGAVIFFLYDPGPNNPALRLKAAPEYVLRDCLSIYPLGMGNNAVRRLHTPGQPIYFWKATEVAERQWGPLTSPETHFLTRGEKAEYCQN
jgi:hypothetical protein